MIDKISVNSDSEEEVTPEATSGDAPTAASNPLRSLEWYLDGRLAGVNAAGANIEAVSAEYTGRGVVIGLVSCRGQSRRRELIVRRIVEADGCRDWRLCERVGHVRHD